MSRAARLVLFGVGAAYALALALLAAYQLRDVLVLLFIAWIIAAALRPPIETLSRRMPHGLAIGLVYLLLILLFALLVFLVVPPLVTQLGQLAERLPGYLEELQDQFFLLRSWMEEHGMQVDIGQSVRQALEVAGRGVGTLLVVPLFALRIVVSFLLVLVLSFYWLLFGEQTLGWFVSFLPPTQKDRARQLFGRAEHQMGAYVRGLAMLSLAIGVLTFIGLSVMGVPYALALSVIAAILELLPNIGPIIAAVPAVIVAVIQNPVLGLAIAGLYLVIQQFENYVLVPKVHQQSVGLSPMAVLIAVVVGTSLAGIAGAFLAVPVAALIRLVLDEWRERKQERYLHAVERVEQAEGGKPKAEDS